MNKKGDNCIRLSKVDMITGDTDSGVTLNITYIKKTDKMKTRITVTDIELPLSNCPMMIPMPYPDDRPLIDVGFGGQYFGYIEEEVLESYEKPPVELTIDEIEEKLGYKIKVVGKKEKVK